MKQPQRRVGLSVRHIAAILGIAETKVTQSVDPSLDKVAVLLMKNWVETMAMLVDRAKNPTPGMMDILERRKQRLKAVEVNGR